MTRIKAISVAALLCASIATPAFAQEVGAYGPREDAYGPGTAPSTYYRSYGQQVDPSVLPPRDNDEYWNLQNFGTTGRSPARPGGENPNLNPPG